jgi:hypothetical protein
VLAHRVEQADVPGAVAMQILVRIAHAVRVAQRAREVEDEVLAGDEPVGEGAVAHVADGDLDIARHRREVEAIGAGVGQLGVEDRDARPRPRDGSRGCCL